VTRANHPRLAELLAALARREAELESDILNIEFDDQVVTLREGDSIAFDAAAAHLLRNRSLAPARVIWFSIDG